MDAVPLLMAHLLCRNHNDRVAPDERDAELALNLAVNALLRFMQDNVDVDVECVQLSNVLPAVLKLYNDAFVSCFVERVQWP